MVVGKITWNGTEIADAEFEITIKTKEPREDTILPITIGEVHVEGTFKPTYPFKVERCFIPGYYVPSPRKFRIEIDPVSQETATKIANTFKEQEKILIRICDKPVLYAYISTVCIDKSSGNAGVDVWIDIIEAGKAGVGK